MRDRPFLSRLNLEPVRRAAEIGLVVLIGVTGIGVNQLTVRSLDQRSTEAVQQVTERRLDEFDLALTSIIERYFDILTTMASAVGSHSSVTPDEFDSMTGVVETLPGATSASLVVPGDEATTWAELETGLTWLALPEQRYELRPDGGIDSHRYLLLMNRPAAYAPASLGLDVGGVDVVTSTMDEARASGAAQMTAPFVPDADQDLPPEEQVPSTVLVVPVYSTSVEDAGTFRGWLQVPVLLGELMATVVDENELTGRYGLSIDDTTDPDEPARVEDLAVDGTVVLERSLATRLGGRDWLFTLTASEELARSLDSSLRQPMILGSLVVTILAMVFVWFLIGARRRAQRLVDRTTVELADDIRRRREVEQTLRRREHDLETFNKTVAERLADPLFTVGRTLARMAETGQIERRSMAGARRQCDQMRRLIEDLLLLSGLSRDSLNLAEVDLWELAREVVDELTVTHPDLERHVVIEPLPEVTVDRHLMKVVLWRLLENTREFALPSTPPEVIVRSDLGGDGWKGEWWRIEVRDRGIGVSDPADPELFRPFGVAADDRPRNRLSLALCDRILAVHGGSMGAEHHPGGGLIVWLQLPLHSVITPATAAGAGAAS